MRFVNAPLPFMFDNMFKDVIKSDETNKLGQIDIDFFKDIFSIIIGGAGAMDAHGVSFEDITKQACLEYEKDEVSNIQKKEEDLTKAYLDISDFAYSDFLKNLHTDSSISIQQKFEMVCKILSDSLSSPGLAKNQSLQNHQSSQSSLDFINSIGINGGGGGSSDSGNQNKHKVGITQSNQQSNQQSNNSDSFNWGGFVNLLDQLGIKYEKQSYSEGSSKGNSNSQLMYDEIMQNKIKISDLVKKMMKKENLKIFKIARNIELGFDVSTKGKLKETEKISSNSHITKMRKMSDIKRARGFELIDKDSFDRKVMNRSIRVKKFKERREMKQCLYALLDNSLSTSEYGRLLFIKAVAIALGKKAIKDKSVFYCRWFDDDVSDLFTLEGPRDWGYFLDFILYRQPNNGTDIDFALQKGIDDVYEALWQGGDSKIDKSDIITITDGTIDINKKFIKDYKQYKADNIKFHFVFLEEEYGNFKNSKRLAETFYFMDTRNQDINNYIPNFRKI